MLEGPHSMVGQLGHQHKRTSLVRLQDSAAVVGRVPSWWGGGGLYVPHGLKQQGLDSRKPGRGIQPQKTLTFRGTARWVLFFQGCI